jgi:hypothetical protein
MENFRKFCNVAQNAPEDGRDTPQMDHCLQSLILVHICRLEGVVLQCERELKVMMLHC